LLLPVRCAPRHLASDFSIFLLTTFKQLGWRLKQLAALKHLKKQGAAAFGGGLLVLSCSMVSFVVLFVVSY
jgi:hypothetical protein